MQTSAQHVYAAPRRTSFGASKRASRGHREFGAQAPFLSHCETCVAFHCRLFDAHPVKDRTRMSEFDGKRCAMELHRTVVQLVCKESRTCSICLENILGKRATYYPCGHALHVRCHLQLKQCARRRQRHRCPECRQSTLPPLSLSTTPEEFIDMLLESDGLDIRQILDWPFGEFLAEESRTDSDARTSTTDDDGVSID